MLPVPLGAAQGTPMNPIVGGYEDIYIVSGRAIDSTGKPVAGGNLRIELQQQGVRAEPLMAKANCFGDFITYFNLRHVDPRGKVSITLLDSEGKDAVSTSLALHPLLRRSDAFLRMGGEWGYYCPEGGELWPGRVSVTGRIVNRTVTPYEREGVVYHARPYVGELRLTYVDETGQLHCPPASVPDKCQPLYTDDRGDFKYSYTFNEEVPGTGRMIVQVGDQSFNATLEPGTRLAVLHVDLSGERIAPAGGPAANTPGPAPLAVLALLAFVALARRHRRA